MAAERESCHPRGLSWFARSCIPADPARHTAVPVPIPIPISSPAAVADEEDLDPEELEPHIAALPDELLLEILARVPRASLPPLAAVCRRFSSLLASPSFLHLRRAHGHLLPSLLFLSPSSSSIRALLLHLPLHHHPSSSSATTLTLPIPIHLPPHAFAHARVVAVGRHVYVVGRGSTVRVDPLTCAVKACAPTLFRRSKFAAAAVGARIYVAGGSSRTNAVEEYDPAADAWRVVAEAPRRRYGCFGAATAGGANGVFYVAGGVSVGASSSAAVHAGSCAGSVDALHVGSGGGRQWWARSRVVPAGGCVVGACGGGDGHLYVVASHAVDLSFWRWQNNGSGGGGGGGGRGQGGGWVALEAPPVPRGAVGLGVAVRVAMAAVGADRVAAVVSVATVRGHASASASAAVAAAGLGGGAVEGMVLVYDIGEGTWSRAPDLPHGFRRAACAAVEC